ncbi:MAG: hypothetical protein IPP07_28405 [Holophagales bacterium]|nr:hypothetical protein [Holophagales bacterium]
MKPADFNQYGARRGNHEVMMRGTFANIRLKNLMLPGTEGGVTVHVPPGEQMSIYDASMKYQASGTPLVVLAGAEYGTGSSRDWAAKGHHAPRRQGRHREELRADPPLQPRRHGRPPAPVRQGRRRAVARPHRPGDLRRSAASPKASPRARCSRSPQPGGRHEEDLHRHLRIDTPNEVDY